MACQKSERGGVAGAVYDVRKLAGRCGRGIEFGDEFLEGLQEEPLREGDLARGAGALGPDAGDRHFLGRGREGGIGEGLEFGEGFVSAEVALNACDFF